jgi:hypothetical protein
MNKRNSGTAMLARDGVEYRGQYEIEKGMITVTLGSSRKTTQVKGSAEVPDGLARLVLSELVDEQLAKCKQR